MAGLPSKQGKADETGTEAPLSHDAVRDVEDTTVTGPSPNLDGKRLQAIPQQGGTRVTVKDTFFAEQGLDHPTVTFDFFRDRFTLPVGGGKALSDAGADALLKVFPNRFKFVNGK